MKVGDFWSRRKAAVQAEHLEEQNAREMAAAAAREDAFADRTDHEILGDLGLPNPDELEAGADFKIFLTENIPARIRNRALRRLWISNPVLANIDGLVDYGEDFTDASCVLDNLQTAYQVGKGMKAHVEEMARQAEELLSESSEYTSPDSVDDTQPVATVSEDTDTPEPTPSPPVQMASIDPVDDSETDFSPPPPRRMRFQYLGKAAES